MVFKGRLFPKSDFTIGEFLEGFLLEDNGGLLNLFLVCGVTR
jgi:hypothetical protein